MKIVFIASRSLNNIGGIETFMKNLIPHLVEMDYEIVLYSQGEHYKIEKLGKFNIVHIKCTNTKVFSKMT